MYVPLWNTLLLNNHHQDGKGGRAQVYCTKNILFYAVQHIYCTKSLNLQPQIPPNRGVCCIAYLLNNHHQDGKGQGAIKRVQDVATIRRAAAIDVLAVKGIENIAAI